MKGDREARNILIVTPIGSVACACGNNPEDHRAGGRADRLQCGTIPDEVLRQIATEPSMGQEITM
jgi:hypothetical protein